MKSIEKSKAQKIINKIQSGSFDENDIDNLFMKLRAYSSDSYVFREIADFVAHNDRRDRGLSNQALELMYLRMRFFFEYAGRKKRLNISKPFPAWIRQLMLLQIEKCREEELKNRFNLTKEITKKTISNAFQEKKKEGIALCRKKFLPDETLAIVQYLMSIIDSSPTFTQQEVINELITVLKDNNLSIDESKIRIQSNRIMVCTLLLFHNSEFVIRKGHKLAECRISSENPSILFPTPRFVDANGNEVKHEESYGNLTVRGIVFLDRGQGKELPIAHDLITTDLKVEQWCSEELFHVRPVEDSKAAIGLNFKVIDLDRELSLNTEFKLASNIL